MESSKSMLVAALLAFSAMSYAGKYEWTGAVDDLWNNPANWDVRRSIYTWPHQQYGDENSRVNDDCEKITIATGQTVERSDGLEMQGASATNNAGKLSIENNSGLYTSGAMWIGRYGSGTVKVEVSNQSSLGLAVQKLSSTFTMRYR
jgi:hypothetical protein